MREYVLSIVTSHFQMCIHVCATMYRGIISHLCNSVLNFHISYSTLLNLICISNSRGKDVKCTYEAASILFNHLSVFIPLQTPPLPTVFKGKLTWASISTGSYYANVNTSIWNRHRNPLLRSLTAYNGIGKSHMRGRLIPPTM